MKKKKKENKICPLISGYMEAKCAKERCTWWIIPTFAPANEYKSLSGECAFTIIAKKYSKEIRRKI